MVFEEFPYQRPQMESFGRRFRQLLDRFRAAAAAAEQHAAFAELNDMRTEFLSMYNLCHIRHTADTADAFYERENDYFDREMPNFQALNNELYRALQEATYRADLEARWGRELFRLAELSLKTFDPSILEDLKEENQLSSEYVKLKAGARISYRGEEYNLSSIRKWEVAPDRSARREAGAAKWRFFEEQREQVENLFDRLVRVRHRIARKLGYDTFTDLAYARLFRSEYGPDEVAAFRGQIAEHVVPVASGLYERQRERLGLDRLEYTDEEFRFRSGNPEPKGDPQWIIGQAERMYRELSDETRAFFDYMSDTHLMDLETRPGKATGGYCTFIGAYKAPFIFSNFNGTSGDIDVLTHEAGHAFQVYASRDIGINEYIWPTLEACEIHSMSMEFFTWPWMELFFGEDTGKYRFAHLTNALYFMPYGAAVDEFQHHVYAHPEEGPAARNAAWRAIERKYLPQRRYDGNSFLEAGGYWHKQSHIFTTPFYYIDYVLAQVCALQFWRRSRQEYSAAWGDYLRLCQAGGSRPFLELVELAGLRAPFGEGVVSEVVGAAAAWLAQLDDDAF